AYNQSFTIKQQAAYIQDEIKAGNATVNLGLRLDHYEGLSMATLAQPRLGVSYAVIRSATVLRASYGRTMETPYNENLLLSAGYGLKGSLAAARLSHQGYGIKSSSVSSRRLGAGWSSTSDTSTSAPTTATTSGSYSTRPLRSRS